MSNRCLSIITVVIRLFQHNKWRQKRSTITDCHITKERHDSYAFCTTYCTDGLYKILNITKYIMVFIHALVADRMHVTLLNAIHVHNISKLEARTMSDNQQKSYISCNHVQTWHNSHYPTATAYILFTQAYLIYAMHKAEQCQWLAAGKQQITSSGSRSECR